MTWDKVKDWMNGMAAVLVLALAGTMTLAMLGILVRALVWVWVDLPWCPPR